MVELCNVIVLIDKHAVTKHTTTIFNETVQEKTKEILIISP